MTKVTYHANGDAPEVEAFGVKFTDGKAVDVSDEVAASLKGNRFFSASKAEKTAEPAKEPQKATPEPTKEETAFTAPLVAKDKGGGWWGIFDANGIEEGKSMRAADAEAFNALSDEDKAEYVK